jgi:hypothetical protein
VRLSLVTGIVVLAMAGLTSTAPAAGSFHHCTAPSPNAGKGPRDDKFVPFGDVKVHRMSCAAALTAIHRGHLNPRFHTPGFSCRAVKQLRTPPPNPEVTGQDIACHSRGRRFRWSWAT